MEILNIDVGLKSYQFVEGGTALRFNPSDPNIYARYMDAMDEIKNIEKEMSAKANAVEAETDSAGEQALQILREADRRMKETLNKVFGGNNDFDKILCGVNLMAVTESGNRVVNSVVDALLPIMENGAKACADTEVATAKLNREQRRAAQR